VQYKSLIEPELEHSQPNDAADEEICKKNMYIIIVSRLLGIVIIENHD